MGAIARLIEVILGATPDDIFAMLDIFLQDHLQSQDLRLDAVDQGQHVKMEGGLQRRMLEQSVKNLLRIRIFLQFNDYSDAILIRFIA